MFLTDDICFKEHYIVKSLDYANIDSNWEVSENYVREIIQQLLLTDETDINKLMNLFNKRDIVE